MYRIGEIAKLKNLSKRTIDYYTQIGLLHPVRTDSNYRLYGEDSIQILDLVGHYKNLNMPLDEIKSSIELLRAADCSIDKEKLEKHFEQIGILMHHLKEELDAIDPFLQKLTPSQKELVVNKLSVKGVPLAQTLLLLFQS